MVSVSSPAASALTFSNSSEYAFVLLLAPEPMLLSELPSALPDKAEESDLNPVK
jgi:hypothetical protein